MSRRPVEPDYKRLLQFRTGLRRFLRWSEEQAKKAGLTAAQYQLLLAVRGHDGDRGPTIGDVAGYSCCGTTARSGSWTAPSGRGGWSAAKTRRTAGWCACA